MSVITVTSDSNNLTISTIETQGDVSVSSSSVSSSNTISQTDPDNIVSINLPTEITNSVNLNNSTSENIIKVIIDNTNNSNVITTNQGSQGPAGSAGLNGIVSVLNYGDNRLLTSSSTDSTVNAESNLLFDGSILSISGIAVSISGHQHYANDIMNLSSTIDSRINNNFQTISTIGDLCDISSFLIKDTASNFKLVNMNNLINIITEIDGGGVINSNC